MTRYLARLANAAGYTPKDIDQVSSRVRMILGSRERASHFRISGKALEFNIFASDSDQLETLRKLLEGNISKIIEVKRLDTIPTSKSAREALREGMQLFNEERFWECHEILEQAWHPSTGRDRDTIQGLILTAAAFVHFQKGEDNICLSILKRARSKILSDSEMSGIDLAGVNRNIDAILNSNEIRPFMIK